MLNVRSDQIKKIKNKKQRCQTLSIVLNDFLIFPWNGRFRNICKLITFNSELLGNYENTKIKLF